MKQLKLIIDLLPILFLLVMPVMANQQSLDWLADQQQNNGSFASQQNISTAYQSTSELLNLYKLLNYHPDSILAEATDFLEKDSTQEIEYFSRFILAKNFNEQAVGNLFPILLDYQNENGGFSTLKHQQSSLLATAYALTALSLSNDSSYDEAIVSAIGFIASRQHQDGSFTLWSDENPSILLTAILSSYLQQLSFNFPAAPIIDQANDYLSGQQNPDNNWEDDELATAWALLALIPRHQNPYVFAPTHDWLYQQQQDNGSWDNDVYKTAIIMQALSLYIKAITPPNENSANVYGRVIKAGDQTPLAGVTVELDGPTKMEFITDVTGNFYFNQIAAGEYNINYEAIGYVEINQNVVAEANNVINVGDIAMAVLPNAGLIQGTITDAENGNPIVSATIEISGAINTILQTTENGSFAIESPPGVITIKALADGYLSITADATVQAGVVLNFSPALVPFDGEPIVGVAVKGKVVEDQNLLPLVVAVVNDEDTNQSVETNAQGEFFINGLNPGEINLDVSKIGYGSIQLGIIAGDGMLVDVGNVVLTALDDPENTTILGKVLDTNTNNPIVGAKVTIIELNQSIETDNEGLFSFENIDILDLTFNLKADGYLEQNKEFNLANHGVYAITFHMAEPISSDVQITEIYPEQAQILPFNEVEIELHLTNFGNNEHDVRLYFKIIDPWGEIVHSGPAVLIPGGGDPQNAYVKVNPGQEEEAEVEWHNNRSSAGVYTMVVQAVNPYDNTLFDEAEVDFEILAKKQMGGGAYFDPPIAQFAAEQPIAIDASISDRGNLLIGPSQAKATVTLKNLGYPSLNPDIELTEFVGDLDQAPHAVVIDGDGNYLVTQRNDNQVLKITPNGDVEVWLDNIIRPADLVFDSLGNLYILCQHNNGNIPDLYKVEPDMTVTEWKTGLGPFTQHAIEILPPDDRIIIATKNRLYEFENGNANLLVDAGIYNPENLVINSQGAVFIADSGSGRILQYDQGILSTFAKGLNQPSGMTIDDLDNLYVVDFADNALYQITPDVEIVQITDQLSGPKDVAWYDTDHLLISNYSSHEIVTVTLGGEIERIAFLPIINPTDVLIDNQDAILAPSGKQLWHIGGVNKAVLRAQFDNAIDEITLAKDDNRVFVLDELDYLFALDENDEISKIADEPLVNAKAIDYNENQSALYVAQKYNVTKINDDLTQEIVADSFFRNPIQLGLDNNGNILILSDLGRLTVVDQNLVTKTIKLTSNNSYGFFVEDNNDVVFTNSQSKAILRRIDDGGAIETVMSLNFEPGGLAKGANDLMYVARWGGFSILEVNEQAQTAATWASSPYGIRQLKMDALGNMWASHNNGHVTVYNNGILVRDYTVPGVYDIIPDNNGGALVAGLSKIYKLHDDNTVSTWYENPAMQGQQLTSLVIDQNNWLWITTINDILYQINDQQEIVAQYSTFNNLDGVVVRDDGSMIILSQGNNMMLFLEQAMSLPKVLKNIRYEDIVQETNDTFLLRTSNAIKRYHYGSNSVEDLVNSVTISGLDIFSDQTFIAAFQDDSELKMYDVNGSIIDQLAGIHMPKAITKDQNNNIYVGTEMPGSIVKIELNEHPANFIFEENTSDLLVENDGKLLSSYGNNITRYDVQGNAIDSYAMLEPVGLAKDINNMLWLTSTHNSEGGLLFQEPDFSFTKAISGFKSITDLTKNSFGELFIADYIGDIVVKLINNESLSAYLTGVPYTSAVAFDQSDKFYAAYNDLQVATYDSNQVREEFTFSGLTTGLFSELIPGKFGFIAATTNNNDYHSLQKIVFPELLNIDSLEPGDIIYEQVVAIPELLPDQPVDIDFGEWLPPISGDYLLEVTIEDNEVDGKLSTTLHVGNAAIANFTANQTLVGTGDQPINAAINVYGIDQTSITQIDTDNLVLAAESGAQGRALASDSQGNIYVADIQKIVRVSPGGVVEDFVTDIYVGEGMAVGPDDALYAFHVNDNIVYRITPDAQVEEFVTLNTEVNAIAIGPDEFIYALDQSRLYRIHPDKTLEIVNTPIISDGLALAIDIFGYFYVLKNGNGDTHKIIRIAPDGSTSIYFDQAKFEFEGVNVITDCSNNLLFAPLALGDFKEQGEEDLIFQLTGNNGELSVVLDGPPIDWALSDIDVLYHDRKSNRILVWTDLNNGKVFSFPIVCGGLDASLTIISRSDVEMTNVDPAPTSITPLENNRFEYFWDTFPTNNIAVEFNLNFVVNGLLEAETRPLAEEAYLEFSNSFVPDETVKVPVNIPNVTALSFMSIQPYTDQPNYYSDDPVELAVEVFNENDIPFNGEVLLTIVDKNDAIVAGFDAIAVENLDPQSSQIFAVNWNTGTIIADNYSLEAQLFNQQDVNVAEGVYNFEILAGDGDDVVINGQVATDQLIYNAWDNVAIDGLVMNQANNDDLPFSTIWVDVYDPNQQLIHQATTQPFMLPPAAIRDVFTSLSLVDAIDGDYQVQLSLIEQENNEVIYITDSWFTVEKLTTAALIGEVSVDSAIVTIGQDNTCYESISNIGAIDINLLTLSHRLIALDAQELIEESMIDITLASGETHQQQSLINTNVLESGAYVCQLLANIGDEEKVIGAAGFNVLGRSVIEFGLPSFNASESANTMTIFVNRKANHWGKVSVNYVLDGGVAILDQDYSMSPAGTLIWEHDDMEDKLITVTLLDDNIAEGEEDFILQLKNISDNADYGVNIQTKGLIQDNDIVGISVLPANAQTSESGENGQFAAVLNTQPEADVLIPVTASDLTETINEEAMLMFTTANWNQPQIINLKGMDDDLVDGNILSNINVGPVQSADLNYHGLQAADVIVNNLDNDIPEIKIIGDNLITNEQGLAATLEVAVNSMPQAEVQVNVVVSDLTEATVISGPLVFTQQNWDQNQAIKIMGLDDPIQDGDVEYEVTINVVSADIAYNGLTIEPIKAINQDDDIAGITTNGQPFETTEQGGQATIGFKLNTEPAAQVTINLVTSDPTEGKLMSGNIVITPANWQIEHMLTVQGVDDFVVDGDVNYQIEIVNIASADIHYADLQLPALMGTNLDNDIMAPEPPLSQDPVHIPINDYRMLLLLVFFLVLFAIKTITLRKRQ